MLNVVSSDTEYASMGLYPEDFYSPARLQHRMARSPEDYGVASPMDLTGSTSS